VRVDCPIEQAFRLFTESFAQWWPLASYSISGEEAETCALEPWVGGRVWERTRSGEEREWGSTFTWHPGGPEDRRQIVDVDFQVEADGTRVTLIHTGWDAPGVATCTVRFSQFVSERMLVLV
jgi:hypothetical protein